MNSRVVPKWLAGALVAMLVIGAISVINAAQAAPTFHPLTAPLSSSAQSKPAQGNKPALPAKGNPLSGLLGGLGMPASQPAPPQPPALTPTPDPCAVGWSEQAAYPTTIYAHAVAAQGSYLYSFGGTITGTYTIANAYKYNGTSWSAIAALPDGRYLASAVSNGTYLYILNGIDSSVAITNTLYRYDPSANTYSILAAPVYTSAGQAAIYLNGKIYRIGGVGAGNSTLNSVEVYDIASNTWSTAANYPTPIVLESAVAIGGYIYTAGGNTSNIPPATITNKTYRYNPSTNLWEDGQIDDLAQPREAAAADVFNGQFLIAGGAITSTGVATITNTALSWNPSGNVWTNLPNMVVPRYLNGGATLGGAFYSVGGVDLNGQASDDNQRYAPNGCATPTPGPTPTTCPIPFTDIGGNIFYNAIVYLYCRGVVNGTDPTHYSPAGTSTRAQFAKVVVLGFGTPFYTPGSPDFTDVPPGYFAYLYIETGFHAGILSGFDAAGCTAHGATYPCYLPNIPITRAQLTKLVVGAAQYPPFTPSGGGQTFSDVPSTNIFYVSIETAHNKGVINGYPDGTFRPNNNIRRDEMAQIVYKGVTTP